MTANIDIDLEQHLARLGRDYRSLRYRGPALRYPPAPAPRRSRHRLVWIGAATGALTLALWLALPAPHFSAPAVASPSPYAVLKQVRQALPEPPSAVPATTLPITPPSLPPAPIRQSGFAQPARQWGHSNAMAAPLARDRRLS